MSRQRIAILLTFFVVLLASAGPSFACTVCFGQADSPMVEGLQVSVLFMVGVTYFVILSGVATFFVVRMRARRAAAQAPATSSQVG